MPNMSYCRFQNTVSALSDCIDKLDEMQWNLDMTNEKGEPVLSPNEREAAEELMEIFARISKERY